MGLKQLILDPPSGTRDFLPEQLARREEAIRTIQAVFTRFGFQPMQTPAFERIEILTGKYGEEEKLIFKIQRRGDRADEGADLALRYDLTVPLARFVARYQGRLPKVFRRCQIGPVWRADRPGKGRFREFWQCDVDTIGTSSPLADSETILAIVEALAAVGLSNFEVRLNSRPILKELMVICGVPGSKQKDALIALDKIDKVGAAGVEKELVQREVPPDAVDRLLPLITAGADDLAREVTELLRTTVAGEKALADLLAIQQLVEPMLKAGRIRFAPLLARGLDYYTGMIFEIYTDGFSSAIAAGGRYDELLGMFRKDGQSIPACGGSIGLERVLELLEQTSNEKPVPPAQVMVTVWDDDMQLLALKLAQELRSHGIATEVALESGGIVKQLRYASKRKIPYVIIQGPDEVAAGNVQIKNMNTGDQVTVAINRVAGYISDQLSARLV